ncbi:MAG: regulator [Bacteroidetes bacterium GWE2_42_24]|nr:MAG: regulator [Bacteroidetes bacterium GWE2_42_24]OFY32289.1 MAG: regulator [Bacteroidetes bacterium GWF2_43_11]
MAAQLKIYVVEDDPLFAKTLKFHLSLNPDYEVEIFSDGRKCIDNLFKNPALITLDYNLPGMSGLNVLKKIKELNPDLPVIIISSQHDVKVAVDLLKEGAYDYIVKDEDMFQRLWRALGIINERMQLQTKIRELETEIGKKYKYENLIKGQSLAIQNIFAMIEKATKTNITVSITGETGTGKELVAKAIHFNSDRKNKAFVAVNVSAIPSELIESELFGHEKGSFTDAFNRRIGRFEEANYGTLFLDEIGDMDLSMQTKLLRVLQEEELSRVGGNSIVKLNVRVIVATHKNLAEEVKKGKFREDLYYRLLGLPITLPPLRDRDNDVIFLAKHFIDEFVAKNKMSKITITQAAQEKLRRYPFPGNIRELKAVVELAAIMTNNEFIEPDHLVFSSTSEFDGFLSEELTMREYYIHIIKHYLKKYNNKVTRVAEVLEIGKSSIYNLIKEEGMV